MFLWLCVYMCVVCVYVRVRVCVCVSARGCMCVSLGKKMTRHE